MSDLAIEREGFDRPMRGMQNRHPRSLVHSARLHSDKSIFNQVYPAHSVLAAGSIEPVQQTRRGQRFAIDCSRRALLKFDLDISGPVGSLLGRARHYENILRRLGPGVFQYSALVA